MSASTYFCNYCFQDHDILTKSREHIIPERLLNSSYVLPDTCNFWNNFFSLDFEAEIVNSAFLLETLDTFGFARTDGVQYLGPVTTQRGTTEHRWRINGKTYLRDIPETQYSRMINLNLPSADGDTERVQVELPFDVPIKIYGDAELISKKMARFEKERESAYAKVEAYLNQVVEDRSINPDLHDTIHRSSGKKVSRTDLGIQEESIPASEVADIAPLEFPFDPEAYHKFYTKIAWCHACKVLGVNVLSSISSWNPLDYLKCGLIPTDIAERCDGIDAQISSQLISAGNAGGVPVRYWRKNLVETVQLLASAPAEICWELGALFEKRQQLNNEAASRITLNHNELLIGGPGRENQHRLRLMLVRKYDWVALCCRIELFGGLLQAVVRLSDRMPPTALPGIPLEEKVITF